MSAPPTPRRDEPAAIPPHLLGEVRAIAYALDPVVLSAQYGMSLSELARRSGLAVETVRKQQRVHEYEPDAVPQIALHLAARIADALGRPVGALFCHPNGDPIGSVR